MGVEQEARQPGRKRSGVASWHPRLSVVTADAKRTDTRHGRHGTPRCMKVAAFEQIYNGESLDEDEFYAKTISRGSHYVAALLANYPNTFERLPSKTAIVLYDGTLHDLLAYKIVGHTIPKSENVSLAAGSEFVYTPGRALLVSRLFVW